MVVAEKRTFKIGEVCRVADLQPYVLRYWETEFPPLAPGKSGGGQRVYSQREIDIILRIKQLLYTEGFTIAGAKKKLEGELNERMELEPLDQSSADRDEMPTASRGDKKVIARMKRDLREILEMLER